MYFLICLSSLARIRGLSSSSSSNLYCSSRSKGVLLLLVQDSDILLCVVDTDLFWAACPNYNYIKGSRGGRCSRELDL